MNTVYRLFEGIGIELEYMIVDRSSTAVRANADALFAGVAGNGACDYTPGLIGWSNELARHVVELKNTTPIGDISGITALFHEQVREINRHLLPFDCRLMPGGMHPLMDPLRESALWPVDDENIYRTYDRIFNCNGHGWTNLQSIHCNISFADDEEFARLHTAIRLILPLLPALCASTPFVEGTFTGLLDNRLEFYRNNQKKIPLATGHVIPEAVFSRDEYEDTILQPLYRQIAPFDPDNVVQFEWLNSRGAIARFDRMAIEIRLMDIQECPAVDCAVCALVIETVKALAREQLSTFALQRGFTEIELEHQLLATIRDGCSTVVSNEDYLRALGIHDRQSVPALAIWEMLTLKLLPENHFARPGLQTILSKGTLARRMVDSTGPSPDREQLIALNNSLCDCLQENRPYA